MAELGLANSSERRSVVVMKTSIQTAKQNVKGCLKLLIVRKGRTETDGSYFGFYWRVWIAEQRNLYRITLTLGMLPRPHPSKTSRLVQRSCWLLSRTKPTPSVFDFYHHFKLSGVQSVVYSHLSNNSSLRVNDRSLGPWMSRENDVRSAFVRAVVAGVLGLIRKWDLDYLIRVHLRDEDGSLVRNSKRVRVLDSLKRTALLRVL